MPKFIKRIKPMERRKTVVLPTPEPTPYIVRRACEVLTEENETRGVLAMVNIFYRDGILSRQYRQYDALRDGTFRLYRDASDAIGVVVSGDAPLIIRTRGEYVSAAQLAEVA